MNSPVVVGVNDMDLVVEHYDGGVDVRPERARCYRSLSCKKNDACTHGECRFSVHQPQAVQNVVICRKDGCFRLKDRAGVGSRAVKPSSDK